MKNTTRFTFVRNRDGRPVGCIAYRLDREQGNLNYEVSTHNPQDEYNRATARFVAEGRLNKHPRTVSFNPRQPPKLDTLLESAVGDLIFSETVPNRLKKALRLRQEYLAGQRADVSAPDGGFTMAVPSAIYNPTREV